MNYGDEETRWAAFEAQHGEAVWQGRWGFTADGCEIEAASMGYRFLRNRSPERKREVQRLFWTITLANKTREFNTLKGRLQQQAETATLTDADVQQLKHLQSAVQQAADMLASLETPSGPDEQEVAKAIRLYCRRKDLADGCTAAQRRYESATAGTRHPNSAQVRKLAERWREVYDQWDAVNQQYEALPEDVRREANRRCWQAEAQLEREEQQQLLSEIVV